MTRLGTRQRRFVDEYMTDCNATRAAIAAGYSKRTASQAGWEVLRNPKVAAEIGQRQKRLAERHQVSAENVVSELSKLAFSNLADFYTTGADGRLQVDIAALADPAKAAALSQIEITEVEGKQAIKFKLADKRAALGDLGRHLGLFTDRLAPIVPVAPIERPSLRQLALGALALLSAAEHEPKTIESSVSSAEANANQGGEAETNSVDELADPFEDPDWDDFNLDD